MVRALVILGVLALLVVAAAAAPCVKDVETPADDAVVVTVSQTGDVDCAIAARTLSLHATVSVLEGESCGSHVAATLAKAFGKAALKAVVILVHSVIQQ